MKSNSKLTEILDNFKSLKDVDLQSQLLIDYADSFQSVPLRVAQRPFSESNRVPACESEAYVWVEKFTDQTLRFYFAVENPQGISAKALAVILDQGLSGGPIVEAAEVDPSIVYDIFGKGISMGKGQGLMGMVNMVRALARSL